MVESLGSALSCGVLAVWCKDGWCCARRVVTGFPEACARFFSIVAT